MGNAKAPPSEKNAGRNPGEGTRPVAQRAQSLAALGFVKMTEVERVHSLNRENIIEDLRRKARRNPNEKIHPQRRREAEEEMAGFAGIEAAIRNEMEKLRGQLQEGTYPRERPKEFAEAISRVCLAWYLVDKIKEIHGRVLEIDRNSLLEVFIIAARGIRNMLSGDYFRKSSMELLMPFDFGYMDFRVEPPLVACAEEAGAELLAPGNAKNSYLAKVLEELRKAAP